jgi:hypothetical protein
MCRCADKQNAPENCEIFFKKFNISLVFVVEIIAIFATFERIGMQKTDNFYKKFKTEEMFFLTYVNHSLNHIMFFKLEGP